MSGQHNIPPAKASLEERGLPAHSYFEATLEDGTVVREQDHNWSDMSEMVRVGYFGGTKTVHLSTFPVERLVLYHNGDMELIDVPADCRVYQAVRSLTSVFGGDKKDEVIGRVLGLVRDGEVIEERFMNGVEGKTYGMRK